MIELNGELLDGFYLDDGEATDDDWDAEIGAYPDAGPVTVTRADGSTTVEAAYEGGDSPA